MGLLKLVDKHSPESLEAASEKALTFTASQSYKSVTNILKAMKDSSKMKANYSKPHATNTASHEVPGITGGKCYDKSKYYQ